jgi:hypothetical protein
MFPEPLLAQLGAIVAALSEGQRAIAHLVVLLGVPALIGLVVLVRRARRPEQTPDPRASSEENR